MPAALVKLPEFQVRGVLLHPPEAVWRNVALSKVFEDRTAHQSGEAYPTPGPPLPHTSRGRRAIDEKLFPVIVAVPTGDASQAVPVVGPAKSMASSRLLKVLPEMTRPEVGPDAPEPLAMYIAEGTPLVSATPVTELLVMA